MMMVHPLVSGQTQKAPESAAHQASPTSRAPLPPKLGVSSGVRKQRAFAFWKELRIASAGALLPELIPSGAQPPSRHSGGLPLQSFQTRREKRDDHMHSKSDRKGQLKLAR